MRFALSSELDRKLMQEVNGLRAQGFDPYSWSFEMFRPYSSGTGFYHVAWVHHSNGERSTFIWDKQRNRWSV